jgi:hypothetical protein
MKPILNLIAFKALSIFFLKTISRLLLRNFLSKKSENIRKRQLESELKEKKLERNEDAFLMLRDVFIHTLN